jgi:RNA polymerase sigma-70 factor, ECF subfamily
MTKQSDQYLSELLQEAQRGDRTSLNTLCKEIETILRGYFWNKFQDKNIVDDLSQETYIRLFHAIPNVKEPTKFRSFVTKIAVHVSQDFLRQKYRVREVKLEGYSGEEDSPTTQDKAIDPIEMDEEVILDIDLKKAMNKLNDRSRRILLMKIDGYKYEEIAKEIGISVSGVKMQVQRSIEHLRSSFFCVTFFVFISTILIKALG